MANGKPRAAFYVVLLLVVAGLVYLGLHRYGGKEGGIGSIFHPSDAAKAGLEASDTSTVTTAKEYTYVPAQRLPPVRGISNYKPLANRTVRMALNVWAGWAPVIYANGGFKAGKVWHTPGNLNLTEAGFPGANGSGFSKLLRNRPRITSPRTSC